MPDAMRLVFASTTTGRDNACLNLVTLERLWTLSTLIRSSSDSKPLMRRLLSNGGTPPALRRECARSQSFLRDDEFCPSECGPAVWQRARDNQFSLEADP